MRRILLLCICISVARLSAAVVTVGAIQLTRNLGSFILSGNDFMATGVFDDGSWGPQFCNFCPVGTVLSVNGLEVGSDFGPFGSAIVNGVPYPSVNWGDQQVNGPQIFRVTGPPVILTGPGLYFSTFSFTGGLCGSTMPGGPARPCDVGLPALSGSGTVTILVNEQTGGHEGETLVGLQQATYTFAPEPSAFLPGVVSLVAVILAARRKAFGIPLQHRRDTERVPCAIRKV
jgi:hypothetical protein